MDREMCSFQGYWGTINDNFNLIQSSEGESETVYICVNNWNVMTFNELEEPWNWQQFGVGEEEVTFTHNDFDLMDVLAGMIGEFSSKEMGIQS